MNLIDGLNSELTRARELLKLYEGIPTGAFGVALIKTVIEHAELSMRTDNLPEMMKAYDALRKLE